MVETKMIFEYWHSIERFGFYPNIFYFCGHLGPVAQLDRAAAF
jgi:hypothetical protein